MLDFLNDSPAGTSATPSQLNLVMFASLGNPVGGFFTRFDSTGSRSATPDNTPYHSDMDSMENSSGGS